MIFVTIKKYRQVYKEYRSLLKRIKLAEEYLEQKEKDYECLKEKYNQDDRFLFKQMIAQNKMLQEGFEETYKNLEKKYCFCCPKMNRELKDEVQKSLWKFSQ